MSKYKDITDTISILGSDIVRRRENVIKRGLDILQYGGAKILKHALSYNCNIIIKFNTTSVNGICNINNLTSAPNEIMKCIDDLTNNKKDIIKFDDSRVVLTVDNIIYDLNPLPPKFFPLFQIGNSGEYLGSYDDKFWIAKQLQ